MFILFFTFSRLTAIKKAKLFIRAWEFMKIQPTSRQHLLSTVNPWKMCLILIFLHLETKTKQNIYCSDITARPPPPHGRRGPPPCDQANTPPDFTFPAKDGVAFDDAGAKYYEVKSNDRKIEGCYEKINFHNENNKKTGHKYPIYKQTGGHKDFYYLKIAVNEVFAPWLFTDKKGNVIYR